MIEFYLKNLILKKYNSKITIASKINLQKLAEIKLLHLLLKKQIFLNKINLKNKLPEN